MKAIMTAIIITIISSPLLAEDTYAFLRNDTAHYNCETLSNMAFISNSYLSKHCSSWIVKQGIISRGDHKGETWGHAYPKGWFIDATKEKTFPYPAMYRTPWVDKQEWKMVVKDKSHVVLRTKRISDKDMGAYLKKVGLSYKDKEHK